MTKPGPGACDCTTHSSEVHPSDYRAPCTWFSLATPEEIKLRSANFPETQMGGHRLPGRKWCHKQKFSLSIFSVSSVITRHVATRSGTSKYGRNIRHLIRLVISECTPVILQHLTRLTLTVALFCQSQVCMSVTLKRKALDVISDQLGNMWWLKAHLHYIQDLGPSIWVRADLSC